MLKLVSILSRPQQQQLRNHLHGNRSLLSDDISSYGSGRQRYWLQHQPILGSGGRRYQPAFRSPKLWSLCRAIYRHAAQNSPIHSPTNLDTDFQAELGLVAYGAVGIRQHRDDPYAACPAVTINLSTEPTEWGYTPTYTHYEKRRPRRVAEQIYTLPPGAVIMFNSQNPHRVVKADPDRWSINLWSISPPVRPYFQHYLTGQPMAGNNTVSFFPQVGEKSHGQKRDEGRSSRGPTMGLPRTRPRQPQW